MNVKVALTPIGYEEHTLNIPEDDPIDLSQVSTADLHRELARRTGVREIVYGPEDNVYICGNDGVIIDDYGPIRVLVNAD